VALIKTPRGALEVVSGLIAKLDRQMIRVAIIALLVALLWASSAFNTGRADRSAPQSVNTQHAIHSL